MAKPQEGDIGNLITAVQSYYPDVDGALLRKAHAFAAHAHKDQLRSSGDLYIVHPTQVAITLAKMRLDLASIMTGLLHDTVEDTTVTREDIKREFGEEVAELVEGVTKLSKITFKTTEEKQAENFRKMVVAMAKDIRVILVKLADRLNNMQTLEHLPVFKQKATAQETLDIYAPIANRLGISWIKTEYEDLCLRYLHPDIYYKLKEKVSKSKKDREKYIDDVCQVLRDKLTEYEVKSDISGRAKHFYSIYKKMERRNVDFEQIHDLIAFRIIVDNITECYKALGVIHAAYKPVPGRFKDYIAMPKANSYQSLHTTVIGPQGERIEIQIRTQDMNRVAEGGIAAHWQYKEGKFDSKPPDNIEWVHRLLEWQKDLSDPNEFLETVKIDLFAEDVFIFTPRGEVRQLPYGSTPLDFAYAIHTDVGHKCIGAKVNGKIVPLKHRLKSGDAVEIITSPSQTPSKDWLKIVKTSRAKAKIRAHIKNQEHVRARELGEEILEKILRKYQHNYARLERTGGLKAAAEKLNYRSLDELLSAIGYGRAIPENVVKCLISKEDFEKMKPKEEEPDTFLQKVFKSAAKRSEGRNAISVANLNDVLIRFARCCHPVPGDSIIGYITRGRGVTVHAANCPKALDADSDRRVDVKWNIASDRAYKGHAKIRVFSHDDAGLLATMTQTITACGVNIRSANVRTTKDKKAIAIFDVEVSDAEQLQKVTSTLEGKKGIISVERTRS